MAILPERSPGRPAALQPCAEPPEASTALGREPGSHTNSTYGGRAGACGLVSNPAPPVQAVTDNTEL